jgi:hypothetical protein
MTQIEHLAERGGTAIIASSNAERFKQAVATIDLSDEQEIQSFFHKIGDFDHLVFTAGDTLQLNELAATDLRDPTPYALCRLLISKKKRKEHEFHSSSKVTSVRIATSCPTVFRACRDG